MNAATLFGSCGAVLVGFGLYGLITDPEPLRKILAFNLLGGGVFLVFGAVARRAAAAGLGGDPVPQAMVITAIVVAFAATAMAVALVLRLLQETGRATLSSDDPGGTKYGQRRSRCLTQTVLPDATTTNGALLVLAIVLPIRGRSVVVGPRRAARRKDCLRSPAVRSRPCACHLRRRLAKRPAADLHRGGLEAPARYRVARRRTFGGDDDNQPPIVICAVGVFAHADFGSRAGTGESARTVRILDPADGDLGRDEYGLPGRRSVHAIRRARAADLRRGAAGLPRWPCGNTAGRAAIPALRPPRLDSLSARSGPALRQLWRRSTSSCCPAAFIWSPRRSLPPR